MRFAKANKRSVYTWVDKLVNAPVDVSAAESEQLDPAARRYVVIGCPCYITRNNNSAATGIVNGSYGCVHSLTWHDEDEISEIPQGLPGELIEVPVPKTINVFFKGKVVPVRNYNKEKLTVVGVSSKKQTPSRLRFCSNVPQNSRTDTGTSYTSFASSQVETTVEYVFRNVVCCGHTCTTGIRHPCSIFS